MHERRFDNNVHAAFLTVQGAILMDTVQNGDTVSTTVPEGVAGQVYVILVRGDHDVTDANTLAGPAILEVVDKVDAPNGFEAGEGEADEAGSDDEGSEGAELVERCVEAS